MPAVMRYMSIPRIVSEERLRNLHAPPSAPASAPSGRRHVAHSQVAPGGGLRGDSVMSAQSTARNVPEPVAMGAMPNQDERGLGTQATLG